MRSDFPAAAEEIELPWLRARLREAGVADADSLAGVTADPVPKQGMTSVSTILRLHHDGAVAEATPRALIAKFSSDVEPVKQALAANRGFEREVAFYSRFGAKAGIPVPRCYWARYDPDTERCGLLLEFVEETHVTDQFSGAVAEIESVIDHLAPFHAAWWRRDAALAPMHDGLAPFMTTLMTDRLAAAIGPMRDQHADRIGPAPIRLVESWLGGPDRFVAHEEAVPRTLVHGDLHRDQILFSSTSDLTPTVIDWQLAARDSGTIDLAHLLVSGLRPDQRVAHADALIDRYHAGLRAAGVGDYPREALMGSLRIGIARIVLFYMTAFSLGDVAPVLAWWENDPTRRHHDFWDVTCGWSTQALDQFDVQDYINSLG